MNLKIALFTYSTKPRGSVIHTLELANALHELGHQVCIYALDKDGLGFDYPLTCDYKPVPTKPAPGLLDRIIQQRIQEFIDALSLESLEYDCYHAQDCISANALAVLREHGKIPHFIRTVHHVEDYSSTYLQQCQERSIREASLCLCVSDRWQRELKQHYGIHGLRVNNGVNLKRFSPTPNGVESELKKRLSLVGTPLYLTVGGIEPRKNSLNLLRAFAQDLVAFPKAQLIIAGGATVFDYRAYQSEFFELANALNITVGSNLILPGVLSETDLAALYRIADAFVFPSLVEGWGLVVLEAIASGLPAIVSNQTPFTEFLSPHQALLVNPHDPVAIAQAMKTLLSPHLSHAMMQNCQSVIAEYTWETSAKMHINHYQTLLNFYA
jgi:glycosyltransferase-like protein